MSLGLERVEHLGPGRAGPGRTDRDLRQSLNDLNRWLRYALGEYDEPPRPLAVSE